MQESSWSQALTEIVQTAVAAFVRFWKQDMVQVLLTVGMFLALALPLLLVVLLLWYLDATGWRPSSGFYTIGRAQESQPLEVTPMVARSADSQWVKKRLTTAGLAVRASLPS